MANIAKKDEAYLSRFEDLGTALGALRENVGTEALTKFDLPRVKVPAGGAQHVIMPDGEPAKTVAGVIVFSNMSRSYWPKTDGDEVSGGPPQCSSDDAITGAGDPGGDCGECPMAGPGSSGKGRSQACKLMRNVYLLLPGQILPVILQCPPGSLKSIRKYVVGLGQEGKYAYSVETEVGGKAVKNQAGQTYTELTFRTVRDIEGEELARLTQFAGSFRQTLGLEAA